MDKLKFRAYDTTRREYLSAGNIFISIEPRQLPQDSNIYLDMIKYPNMYKDRFVIEQYIGVNDKNGIEIYEGDILKTNRGNFVVKRKGYMFVADRYDNSILDVTYDLFSEREIFEIVGNIHIN